MFPLPRSQAEEGAYQRSLATELKKGSEEVLDALRAGDKQGFLKSSERLISLRDEAGYDSLNRVSLEIIKIGGSNREMLDAAARLSPYSVEIAAKEVNCADIQNLPAAIKSFLWAALKDPRALGMFLSNQAFPILWAMILAAQTAFVLLLAARSASLVSRVSEFVPLRYRALWGPPTAIALAAAPLSLPPMLCLAFWSILALISFRGLRTHAWLTVFLLGIGLAAAPASERAAISQSDSGFLAMMRVLSADWAPGDLEAVESFSESRPGYGPALAALGEAAKRAANRELSLRSFKSARELMPATIEIDAALAGAQYLSGMSEEGRKTIEKVLSAGLRTVESYFLASLIIFDLGDTEQSRKYVDLARNKNRSQLDKFLSIEERFGEKAAGAVPSPRLPGLRFLPAVYDSDDKGADKTNSSLRLLLLSGSQSRMPGALAILAIIFGLLAVRGDRRGVKAYFPNYQHPSLLRILIRVLPGGADLERGRFARCSLYLFTLIIAALGYRGIVIPKAVGALYSYLVPGALIGVILYRGVISLADYRAKSRERSFYFPESAGSIGSAQSTGPLVNPLIPWTAALIILSFGLVNLFAGINIPAPLLSI